MKAMPAFSNKLKFWAYVGGALAVLYLLFLVTKGFIWFLIQTVLYAGLVLALLIFLKSKGFFK